MTLIESALIISGLIASLIGTICLNIRHSRCEIIQTPCLSCRRKPMTSEELTSYASGMTSGMKNDVLYSGGSTPKMSRVHSEGDYNKAT
jgi:hypothetical protein